MVVLVVVVVLISLELFVYTLWPFSKSLSLSVSHFPFSFPLHLFHSLYHYHKLALVTFLCSVYSSCSVQFISRISLSVFPFSSSDSFLISFQLFVPFQIYNCFALLSHIFLIYRYYFSVSYFSLGKRWEMKLRGKREFSSHNSLHSRWSKHSKRTNERIDKWQEQQSNIWKHKEKEREGKWNRIRVSKFTRIHDKDNLFSSINYSEHSIRILRIAS